MIIATTKWNTEAERRAYVSGVDALTDLVIDFAQRSVSVREWEEQVEDGTVYHVEVNDNDDDEPEAAEEENEHAWTNYYVHCKTEWNDDWSCQSNDRCPVCNAEIEPYASLDNSVEIDASADEATTDHHVGPDFIPEGGFPEGIEDATGLEGW